ncbi:hypothetical protein [Alphaspiravirus yamagawaense]|uniref:Uncharacterized protein n=1 Tax=Alphaspiravirus yamagawaense TaxID=1157339 RepID=J7QC80_9VIRU|nr:hypothetical protein [Aeropyrum coil-shaped virus]CCG27864.1 hypothetical protein [Aeropyrum coil-shaped virus]
MVQKSCVFKPITLPIKVCFPAYSSLPSSMLFSIHLEYPKLTIQYA